MQKYNIFFSAERPSPEEIEVHKDFDKVLQQHKSALLYGKLVKAGISLVSVAGLVGAFMIIYPNPSETGEAGQVALVTTQKEMLETLPLQPLADSPAEEQMALASAGTTQTARSAAPAPQAGAKEESPALVLPAKESWKAVSAAPAPAGPAEVKPSEKPNLAVFVKPEPATGYKALHEYFAREMKHPQGEAPDRVSGIVLVSFAINEQGKPEEIEIEKNLDEACDAEAVRLVENMPPWKPATIDGQVVKTRLAVPVRF
jgi:TonB family protein